MCLKIVKMNEKSKKVKRIQYLLKKYRLKSNVTEKMQCSSESDSDSSSDENVTSLADHNYTVFDTDYLQEFEVSSKFDLSDSDDSKSSLSKSSLKTRSEDEAQNDDFDLDKNIAMALVVQYHIETFTPNSSMDKFLKISTIF